MKRSNILTIFVLSFCSLLAEAELEDQHDRNVIKVGVLDYFPMAKKVGDTYIGQTIILFDQIVTSASPDSEIEYLIGPSARIKAELLLGNLDLIYALPDEDLRNHAVEVKTGLIRPIELWSHKSKPITLESSLKRCYCRSFKSLRQ